MYQCCCCETYGSARLLLCVSFGRCAFIPRLQVKLSSLWNITGGLTFHLLFDGDSVDCLQANSGGVAQSTELSPGALSELHATCSCDSVLTYCSVRLVHEFSKCRISKNAGGGSADHPCRVHCASDCQGWCDSLGRATFGMDDLDDLLDCEQDLFEEIPSDQGISRF